MIYFDERGISRLFEVTVGDRTVTWRRDDPDFSQSTTITAENGGDTLVGKGRMSKKGGAWTDDLSQTYERGEKYREGEATGIPMVDRTAPSHQA